MALIPVELAGRAYEVRVGAGQLDNAAAQMGELVASYRDTTRAIPVIADINARRYHGAQFEASFANAGYALAWYELPAGEAAKSWQELHRVTDWLLAQGVGRGDHIVAFGGGVTGDLAGFAASILKRGCGFIQVPTTLLAQVDSSVGGKTAINTSAGKNLVGAFHQPSLVLADLDVLATLPPRELQAGYAEVVKYGVLGDAAFFAWCETDGANVVAGDGAALEYAVSCSVAAKARIVAEDERETTGARALLNLGHTFGHALEAETGYSDALLHGEAVAMGMVLAARYSQRLGLMDQTDAARVATVLGKAGLRTEIAALGLDCDGAALVDHMRHDKKMDGATLPFILLRGIGAAFLSRDVALGDVAAFLDAELAR